MHRYVGVDQALGLDLPAQRFILLDKTILHHEQVTMRVHTQSNIQRFSAAEVSQLRLRDFHS